MTLEEMKRDRIDLMVNPPAIVGPNTVVLCPPVGDTAAYMQYIKDHAADYHRLFYGDD